MRLAGPLYIGSIPVLNPNRLRPRASPDRGSCGVVGMSWDESGWVGIGESLTHTLMKPNKTSEVLGGKVFLNRE